MVETEIVEVVTVVVVVAAAAGEDGCSEDVARANRALAENKFCKQMKTYVLVFHYFKK